MVTLLNQLESKGSSPHSIVVQTSEGNNIDNEIPSSCGDTDHSDIVEDNLSEIIERRPTNTGYNCAGHVWAARRSCIYELKEIRKILEDDNYRELEQKKECMAGDVVLYLGMEGDFLHVAKLYKKIEADLVKWVALSKFGVAGFEAFHRMRDIPYDEYKLEFWTDRPL
jgi:hypothetical protein